MHYLYVLVKLVCNLPLQNPFQLIVSQQDELHYQLLHLWALHRILSKIWVGESKVSNKRGKMRSEDKIGIGKVRRGCKRKR